MKKNTALFPSQSKQIFQENQSANSINTQTEWSVQPRNKASWLMEI